MTERLYFTDSYLTSFDALVVRVDDDGRRLYFDRTAFYPTSGGQPHDAGRCNGIPVIDVIDEKDSIAHILTEPLCVDTVHCEIDWARRYDHMQQHTGQHLLSAVIEELFGFKTLSFHMGAEVSTIEIETPELTFAQIDQAQRRCSAIASESRSTRVSFEAAEQATALRRASDREGLLRIVTIEGLDRSACGGTHVRSTGELGPILIRRQERMRGNTRIEFVCGLRAMQQATSDFRLLQTLARDAGVPPQDLPMTVHALKERLKSSEKERARLSIDAARGEAIRLWQAAGVPGTGPRRSVHYAAIDETSRAFAQAFVEQGNAVVAVVSRDPAAILVSASPDSAVNAAELLKSVVKKHGGVGGGSSKMAQCSVPQKSDLVIALRDMGFDPGD